MSNTGRWLIIDGKLQKVSDEIPKIASRIDGVYFRQPYTEFFNGRDGVEITSKSHKKRVMAQRGVQEYVGDEPYQRGRKIFSYNGQPHRDTPSPTVKMPEHFKKLGKFQPA